MKISDILSPDNVLLDVKASDKGSLLIELARKAAAALGLSPDVVALALLKREAMGSTGVGGGVAVPHARLAEVKAPVGVLARLRKAIPFDAIDGHSVDVVFLLLLPEQQGQQLNALATVARSLRDPAILGALRKAPDTAAMCRALG